MTCLFHHVYLIMRLYDIFCNRWNDVCPSLKLNQHDYVFPRKSYSLWKKINKSTDNLGISSKIIEWESADTIHATIENILGKIP